MAESETYRKGLEMRRKLLGDAYVEKANKQNYNDPTTKKFIDVVTETVFGSLWTRPGLDLKTRTLVCVVSDAATGQEPELAIHMRMALRQGWTEDELTEVLLHLSGYVGAPLVREAFLTAKQVSPNETDSAPECPVDWARQPPGTCAAGARPARVPAKSGPVASLRGGHRTTQPRWSPLHSTRVRWSGAMAECTNLLGYSAIRSSLAPEARHPHLRRPRYAMAPLPRRVTRLNSRSLADLLARDGGTSLAIALGSGGSHGLAHALERMGWQSGVGAERGRGTRVGDSPLGRGGRDDPDPGPAGRGDGFPAPPPGAIGLEVRWVEFRSTGSPAGMGRWRCGVAARSTRPARSGAVGPASNQNYGWLCRSRCPSWGKTMTEDYPTGKRVDECDPADWLGGHGRRDPQVPRAAWTGGPGRVV